MEAGAAEEEGPAVVAAAVVVVVLVVVVLVVVVVVAAAALFCTPREAAAPVRASKTPVKPVGIVYGMVLLLFDILSNVCMCVCVCVCLVVKERRRGILLAVLFQGCVRPVAA